MKKIYLIFIMLIAIPALAQDGWLKKENSFFVIVYPASEQKLADKTMEILMEKRTVINAQLDYIPSEKTIIHICATRQCFREKTRGAIPDWGAGVAYPHQRIIVLKSPKIASRQIFSYQQTVLHEYTHVVLGQVLKDARVPTWFHEGMAMYQAGQFHFDDRASVMWASISGELLPLSSLDSGFPYQESQARLAYLQSLTAIEFMMDSWGEKGIIKLIETIKETDNFDLAIKLAWGINRKRFDDQWRSFVTRKYNWGMIVSNPFVWWIGITILFLVGYWIKRRRTQKVLKKWETQDIAEDLGIHFQDEDN